MDFSRKGDHMTFQSIQVQDLTKKIWTQDRY